ncbi:lysozyme inhibitor LprI family protein [Novosphingobium rosa]|uniref:lysozyme inhibitor LprI family protein n=1 Tax=Novosphingobium rosa TaxID=76978 RepID=UPI00083092BF|nr:lysozyme inhibitor LprI family protein [Novosphingobium rosa]
MILASLFLLAATPAQAFNDPAVPCRNLSASYEMSQCFARALSNEDRGLNQTYNRILRVLNGEERSRLQGAQKQWIAFRDAQCVAQKALYAGGTGGPPEELACRLSLTQDRARSLQRAYGWVLKQRER